MKKLLPLFLLPSLVLAQTPGEEPPAPPSFDRFKEVMTPKVEQALPALQSSHECIKKAESKEDVEACMNAMAQEIQKQSGKEGQAPVQKAPDSFKWTPEAKHALLARMEQTIKQNTAMLECLKASNTKEEMDGCMRAKLPMPQQQKKTP